MRLRSSMKLHTLPLASSVLGNDRRRWCRSRLAVCLFLFLLISAGCAQRPRTIAFIPQETADDLWEPAHVGATNAARGSGFRVYWNGPTRPDDVQRQILLLDRAIQRGDQGTMIAPGQSLALMTPVLRAISRDFLRSFWDLHSLCLQPADCLMCSTTRTRRGELLHAAV